MRKITKLIIHCSASRFGDKALIDDWHKQRGWKGIGYHYVILNGCKKNMNYNIKHDGIIESGRDLNNDAYIELKERGAHAKGFNRYSIGICMIGKDKFTPKQFETLILTCLFYKKLISDIKIIGHYEVNKKKTCPNFDVNIINSILENLSIMSDIKYYLNKHLSIN